MPENTSEDFLRSEGKFAFTRSRVNDNTIQASVPGFAGTLVDVSLPDGRIARTIAHPTDTAESLLKAVGFPVHDGQKFELIADDGLPTYLVQPGIVRKLQIRIVR